MLFAPALNRADNDRCTAVLGWTRCKIRRNNLNATEPARRQGTQSKREPSVMTVVGLAGVMEGASCPLSTVSLLRIFYSRIPPSRPTIEHFAFPPRRKLGLRCHSTLPPESASIASALVAETHRPSSKASRASRASRAQGPKTHSVGALGLLLFSAVIRAVAVAQCPGQPRTLGGAPGPRSRKAKLVPPDASVDSQGPGALFQALHGRPS